MFANLPILEGLHLSHLSCSIHTHVIQEFFDDLNSVSVFDPVVVDGSLTERGHIPVRHAQEYKKLGLPKSLSPFQIQRSTMNNNGILSYSLGCLAGGNAFLPQRPEMSRNFIFPGFVNRHGENHGKKNRDPGFTGKTHGFGTSFRTWWAFRTAKGQHELAERKELAELAELGQLQRQLQEALAKVAAWRKR